MVKQVKNRLNLENYHYQGNMLIENGERIEIDNDGWFNLLKDEEELVKNEPSCYFCGFLECLHEHHIIKRYDGGGDSQDNIIILCPNHHELIHKKGYRLLFNRGFYYLYHINKPKFIKPLKLDTEHMIELPFQYILNNDKLIIDGDIHSKAMVKINKFGKLENGKSNIKTK